MNAPSIHGILESILYGDDLPAMQSFYANVMGLEQVAFEPDRHIFFRCGNGMLLIFHPRSTSETDVTVGDAVIPRHGATGPGHLAFSVSASTLSDWQQHLAKMQVDVESIITWSADRPQVRSIYFRDPAGNSVELACPKLWNLAE